MRLSLSLVALAGLLGTSAATTAHTGSHAAASSVGKKQSLRRTAAHTNSKRHLIDTDEERDDETELKQDLLDDEEFEPEAPLAPIEPEGELTVTDGEIVTTTPMNPMEPVPENLPEIEPEPETGDEPMPENPIELPDNCKDCLGKDSAGLYAFVAEDATGTGSCVVSCDNIKLEDGHTCYSGAENDDKVCKELEKVAKEAEKEAADADAGAEEETAAPPLPSDLTTCEACLGPDAQGKIYAWFPQLGDGGTCLSGCGVDTNSPCFTGAVYSDENCDGIAEAMAKLDEATAAPTDAAEEGNMMPTGAPTMIIDPEEDEEKEAVMEPTSMPVAVAPEEPTFVTPEPTMGGDGEVDVEDTIGCPGNYTVDTFYALEGGDLCAICIDPNPISVLDPETNTTTVEDCTSLCGNEACEFFPEGCGRVICPGDLTADPTGTPTATPTVAPTTAATTAMPTVKGTAAPTTAAKTTDMPSAEPPSGAGRTVATGIVSAVATAAAYLLMA